MAVDPLHPGSALLAQVREGMAVYDWANEQVGTGAGCYLGGEDLGDVGAVPPDSALAEVPPALRARLAYNGFIESAPSLLRAHR